MAFPEDIAKQMIEAAREGNVEFIEQTIEASPGLIHNLDEVTYEGKNIFHTAVEHRRESVFDLIYHVKLGRRRLFGGLAEGNNILHLAAKLPPESVLNLPARVRSQPFEMQEELKWFKKVWKVVGPREREAKNDDQLTPTELFTQTHEGLLQGARRRTMWIAQYCFALDFILAAAMIMAVTTLPRSINLDTGYPALVNTFLFKVYFFFVSYH